ncbi:MAG TPA: glycosyltransferase family 4 protein [Vicinamibacteria bacterium]|nr:glycosyltransferase family 4 protein [Vicinamibacteria bacterium]
MRLLMVTPHLPPYQAANAILPDLLGRGLRERGHAVDFLAFEDGETRDNVATVRRRKGSRRTRVPQALEAAETWWKASPLVRHSDVVHVHSSTWMNQVAARLAHRHRRAYVLTHYGTEIWHHDGKDARFRRMNREAHHVTFYSQALLERARALDVPLRAASVVYPPVADEFHPLSPSERQVVRERYGVVDGPLLLNVKRLHPLADQATLLDAMDLVRRERPDARLFVAGSGEMEAPLKDQAARLGLGEAVRFLGLVPNAEVARLQAAADLFVLSSELEATPTVALEALACGTPVVSTDNPGGVELSAIFGDDVAVVPRKDPAALASAVLRRLAARRRTLPASAAAVADRFRLPGVVERYLSLYEEARRG